MIQHEVTRDLEAERQQIVADLRDKAEAVESAYAAADLSLAELGDVKDEYEGSLRDARQWCAEAGADPDEIDAGLEMPVPQLEHWPLLNHADLLEETRSIDLDPRIGARLCRPRSCSREPR